MSHCEDIADALKQMSQQLLNLMARVKSWAAEPHSMSLQLQLDMAIQCLKKCLAISGIDDEHDERMQVHD